MNIKVKRLYPDVQLPGRATEGSAGIDLRAYLNENGLTLQPMQRELIPTGIALELPCKNCVGLVFSRSGLSIRQGLAMANGVGVIDSDYRGEISVPVINLGEKAVHIGNGERIAQLVIMPVEIPDMIELDTLSDTQRGSGGFGSTGTK